MSVCRSCIGITLYVHVSSQKCKHMHSFNWPMYLMKSGREYVIWERPTSFACYMYMYMCIGYVCFCVVVRSYMHSFNRPMYICARLCMVIYIFALFVRSYMHSFSWPMYLMKSGRGYVIWERPKSFACNMYMYMCMVMYVFVLFVRSYMHSFNLTNVYMCMAVYGYVYFCVVCTFLYALF